MIVLFSDFGIKGPYIGQVQVVLQQQAPGVSVINLIADAPRFLPRASAHLLAALSQSLPPETVILAVVDPGVGSTAREPVIVRADERWYVGPGNGLFDVVMGRAEGPLLWRITWHPVALSASFHGRDLFAPVAAKLARGERPQNNELLGKRCDEALVTKDPGDLKEIIYIDHFGNAMTGVRAGRSKQSRLRLPNGDLVSGARTFHDVAPGVGFWYENSLGLVEIAINQGHAAAAFRLEAGAPIEFA